MGVHKIITVSVLFFAFSCNSGKIAFEDNPPFAVSNGAYQLWYGGSPYGDRGIEVTFTIDDIGENVSVDTVYFRGQSVALVQNATVQNHYKGDIRLPVQQDVIIHEEPIHEMQNPVPDLENKTPFELEKDEAVIRYTEGKKIFYHRVTGLREHPPIAYPASGDPPIDK